MSMLGTEILVNTQRTGDQVLAQTAKLDNGGFVTVWVDWTDVNNPTLADGSWSGIKAQLFSVSGVKAGPEILVNTATLNWQQDPHVTVLKNGNFVVTWTDGWDYFTYADHPGSLGVGGATGDDRGKAVKAQVFSAVGAAIGSELLVNTARSMDQTAQKITALANGNFVITWEDWVTSCAYDAQGNPVQCGGGPSIFARLYDAAGNRVGSEFVVAGTYNYAPKITTLANGGFVVIWHDGHYSVDDAMAQVYTAEGVRVGAEIRVNTAGAGAIFSTQNEEQVVGLANGGFVVTWTDLNGDANGRGVKSQIFDASGARVGAEILVNTTTYADQLHPQTVALKNGGFVVVWDDWSDGIDVQGQVFNNSGARVGTEILVNTTKGGAQDGAQAVALDNGGFAVSWSENWRDVKYQVFTAAGSKIGVEKLANTTTAGDQSGAQLTSLSSGSFLIAWNDGGYGPTDGSGSAVRAQVLTYDQAFTGGVGNDTFTGGAGIDTAIFSGAFTGHSITNNPALGTATITDTQAGRDGTDSLISIERLQFSDKKIAIDLLPTQNAGQALEFVGLLAPDLISNPSIVGTILQYFDGGMSMLSLCQTALDVGLVKSIAGSDSNAALAAMAFKNLVGADAPSNIVDMLVGYMDGRSAHYSRAQFMATIAGLELNDQHIGLVGLQQTGVEYVY